MTTPVPTTWLARGWYELTDGRGWRNLLATAAEVRVTLLMIDPGVYSLLRRRRRGAQLTITDRWLVIVNPSGRVIRQRIGGPS